MPPPQPGSLPSAAAPDELLAACAELGIALDVPASQLEAEAVWRRLPLEEVIRRSLLAKLEALAEAP